MNEFVQQNPALIVGIIGLLIIVLGFFMSRTLSRIDKNMTDLYGKHDKLSEEFHELKGSHTARVASGACNNRGDLSLLSNLIADAVRAGNEAKA